MLLMALRISLIATSSLIFRFRKGEIEGSKCAWKNSTHEWPITIYAKQELVWMQSFELDRSNRATFFFLLSPCVHVCEYVGSSDSLCTLRSDCCEDYCGYCKLPRPKLCPIGEYYLVEAKEGETVISGTDSADCIIGSDSGEMIFGHGGDDIIIGKGGPDIIWGGKGQDKIFGGAGRDTVCPTLGSFLYMYTHVPRLTCVSEEPSFRVK